MNAVELTFDRVFVNYVAVLPSGWSVIVVWNETDGGHWLLDPLGSRRVRWCSSVIYRSGP